MLDWGRFWRRLGLLVVFYLLVAVPFCRFIFLEGMSTLRPVEILVPVWGLFFGPAGCLVCGLGNLLFDFLGDCLSWASIGGLIANGLSPFVFVLAWYWLGKSECRLDSWQDLARFWTAVVLEAAFVLAVISPIVVLWYGFPLWPMCESVLCSNVALVCMVSPGLVIFLRECCGMDEWHWWGAEIRPHGLSAFQRRVCWFSGGAFVIFMLGILATVFLGK